MISRLTALVFSGVLLITSCGSDDPQGEYKDGDSTKGDSSTAGTNGFINNTAPSRWESDWSTDNIVVFQWRAEPENLHPTNGASTPRVMIMDYTQRYLIRLDYRNLELRPDLCEGMPDVSADGLTYTYKLRSDAKWDDGSSLTVDDVVFTLLANTCPSTNNPMYKPAFEYLKSVERVGDDPMKFKVVMSQKYIGNTSLFTNFPVMQESYHDKNKVLRKYTVAQFLDPAFLKTKHPDLDEWAKEFNDEKYGHDPKLLNGLGPYSVTSWDNNSRIELTRKQNHWTQQIKDPDMYDASLPEKIIFRLMTEESAISLELKNQTIDASCWISTHALVELRKDSTFNRNYHSAFVSNYDWQYLGFNLKPESANRTPFFTDKNVRRAIAMLIPADEMNQTYLEGQATRMTSMVPQTRPTAYNSDLKPIPLDVEGAKKLLDAAGWKDTDGDNIRDKVINGKKVKFEFEFLVMTGNPVMPSMAADIKRSLKTAGIEANIQELEFGAFYERVPMHDFDMYFGAWSGSGYNEDYKQIWHTDSWANGGSNFVGFSNPKADELIEKIRVETTDSLRYPMERELQALIYDEQPYVFMYLLPRKVIIHKRFDHAYMFWERPGVYLSWLKLMSPTTMPTTTN